MNNTFKVWAVVLGGLVLLASLFGIAHNISSLGDKIDKLSLPPAQVSVSSLGGTYSQRLVAATSLTISTSTPASLCNTSGRTRIINGEIGLWLDNSSAQNGGPAVVSLDITTSTTAYTTSTVAGSILYQTQSFATSTAAQYIATSTFTEVFKRQWNNNVCINARFGGVSSTAPGTQTFGTVNATGVLNVPYTYKD